MHSSTVDGMASEEIHWTSVGDDLTSPIGKIVRRGHLYDAIPEGQLGHMAIPTRIVGLLDVPSAVAWFERTCESVGLDVVIDHPLPKAA